MVQLLCTITNQIGGEGGTGAAPPEFSNSVGTPLVDAVALTQDLLTGTATKSNIAVCNLNCCKCRLNSV
jgi:glutamate synthase domain-containing protein 2